MTLNLPDWFSGYRPGQTDAVTSILDGFDNHPVVILDAPTGAGKSIIAESVRQHLGSAHSLYLCTTKSLQDQVLRDFPYARVIKGRSNYPTADYPERFGSRVDNLTAGDCTKQRETLPACDACPDDEPSSEEQLHCHYCHPWTFCHYEIAKWQALGAPLAVANTSYFLTECNKGPAKFGGADLVVIDEADRLEAELLNFTEIYISDKRAKQWRLPPPDKKTVADSWQDWIHQVALPRLSEVYASLKGQRTLDGTTDPKIKRERGVVAELLDDLRSLDVNSGNWIYTGYDKGDIRFRPIRVDKLAKQLLWRHGQRFLLMSATIISPSQLAEDLGIDDYNFVAMPSTFPKDRRPIIVRPRADMSRNPYRQGDVKGERIPEMERAGRVDEERDLLVTELETIFADHPTERTLVHTVSYDLMSFLLNALDNPRCIAYNSADDRESTLTKFRATEAAALLAPSLDRGIDLPHDACRVIVVAKVPFPDLSDKRIGARLHGSSDGPTWYAYQAVRTLVQMVGRGMRAEDDWCVTYILDKQFVNNLYKRWSRLFPSWFTEALDFTGYTARISA